MLPSSAREKRFFEMKRTRLFFCAVIGTILFSVPALFGEKPELRIEKILELGKSAVIFSSIESLCEDAGGNFYVLDRAAFKVHKFSPDGDLLLSFGGQGQGPGEFQAPHHISVLKNGSLAVSEDMAFVSLFDTEGNFLERLTAERGLGLTCISEDLFYGWLWAESGRTQHFFDHAGRIQKTFHSVSLDAFSVSAPDESGRLVMFNYATPEIAPSLIFSRSKAHTVAAVGDRYQFPVMDLEGRTISTVQRTIRPQRLKGKEKDLLLDLIEERRGWPPRILKLIKKNMPSTKTLFEEIKISPDFVLVFRIKDDLTDAEAPYPVDFFSLDGVFLGTAELPFVPVSVSGRFLYAAFFDSQDDLVLQKYAYRFKRQS